MSREKRRGGSQLGSGGDAQHAAGERNGRLWIGVALVGLGWLGGCDGGPGSGTHQRDLT